MRLQERLRPRPTRKGTIEIILRKIMHDGTGGRRSPESGWEWGQRHAQLAGWWAAPGGQPSEQPGEQPGGQMSSPRWVLTTRCQTPCNLTKPNPISPTAISPKHIYMVALIPIPMILILSKSIHPHPTNICTYLFPVLLNLTYTVNIICNKKKGRWVTKTVQCNKHKWAPVPLHQFCPVLGVICNYALPGWYQQPLQFHTHHIWQNGSKS